MTELRELVDVSVKMYYEIKNSRMYGGEGSIGYSAIEMDQCRNPDQMTEELLDTTRRDVAALLKVEEENVRMISREEYEANVEDDRWDEGEEAE